MKGLDVVTDAKLTINLDDISTIDPLHPAPADLELADGIVDAALRVGGSPVKAFELLLAAVGAFADRCDERAPVLAVTWTLIDQRVRGLGVELAAQMHRLHPRIVAALADGDVMEPVMRDEPDEP